MAAQPANASNQPYFNKASKRPPLSADNANNAPSNVTVTKMRPRPVGGRERNDSYPTTDEKFAQGYQNVRSVGPGANTNAEPRRDQTQGASVSYGAARQTRRVVRNTAAASAKKLRRKTGMGLKAWRKVKVSTANTWIGAWAVFWYLTFQLPLAVISAAALGMAYAVYNSLVNGPLGFALPAIKGVVGFVVDKLDAILNWALSLFGIKFDPILLFAVPFLLIFVLGLLQLIIAWFIYSILGLRSLSGRGAGIKQLMFIVAGVGYAIPILNMFPLIFLWMAVVWWYPK